MHHPIIGMAFLDHQFSPQVRTIHGLSMLPLLIETFAVTMVLASFLPSIIGPRTAGMASSSVHLPESDG